MSFSTWFYSVVTGTDLAQLDAQNAAYDAQLAAMNQADYGPGGKYYNNIETSQGRQAADRTYKAVQLDDTLSAQGTADAGGQVSDAFNKQLASETSAIGSASSGLISGTLKNIFNLIPWQAWVIGGIALFVWLGGLELLKGSLKPKR